MKFKYIDIYDLYCISIVILIFLLGKSQNDILSLILIIALVPFIFKPTYLIPPIFLLTIFDSYLLAFEEQSFSRYTVILFCIGVVFNMLIKKKRIQHIGDIKIMAILLLLGIIFSYISVYGYTSFPYSYAINITMAICMINIIPSDSDIIIKKLYIYTLLAIAFIIVLISKNEIEILTKARLTIDSQVNPNQFALGCAQLVALIIAIYVNSKNKKIKVFNLILFAFLILILFLSGSRSGVMASLIGTILVYIVAKKTYENKSKMLINILRIIFIVGIIYFIYIYLNNLFPNLMHRFTYEDIIATRGTGRFDIWVSILTEVLPGHYIYGIGFDPLNVIYFNETTFGRGRGAHNVIVEILAKLGIIGLISYLIFFLKIFRRIVNSLNKNDDMIVPFAMLIILIINGLGEDIMTDRFLWYGVGLVYIILNSASKKRFNNEKE